MKEELVLNDLKSKAFNLFCGFAIASALAAGMVGCEEKGPMEKAGEKVDDAADKVGDAVKDAGEEIKDAADGQKQK